MATDESDRLMEEGPPVYDDVDEPPTYSRVQSDAPSNHQDKEDAIIFFLLGLFLNMFALCIYARTRVRRRAVYGACVLQTAGIATLAAIFNIPTVALVGYIVAMIQLAAFGSTFRV